MRPLLLLPSYKQFQDPAADEDNQRDGQAWHKGAILRVH
jgi:hypothetical protein